MVSNNPAFTIIRNGDIYTPEHIGVKDILIVGKKIVAIDEQIDLPENLTATIIDTSGKKVFPGLIDPHVHVLGGGGEGGPATRTPEIKLSDITKNGITTVVGVLGTDNVSRTIDALYAKTRGLCLEGISAYLFTGSFHYPASTITGSIKKDVAFFKEVVGVKTAISDHRDSHITQAEFARLSSEARFGGMLGGKKGVVHVHMGDGE
ncbi:amidohydrolase family protein, partial [archaeon]|nr:amidohydrolase family protein [archaeon]